MSPEQAMQNALQFEIQRLMSENLVRIAYMLPTCYLLVTCVWIVDSLYVDIDASTKKIYVPKVGVIRFCVFMGRNS